MPVNETLRAQLRRARPTDEPRAPRPSPREIQSHIRSGMSAADVATLLGVRAEDVARYERPIIAEREHIVGQALAVPVLIAGELEPDAQPTFGTAVRTKLSEAGATGERWSSWREPDGWIVKVEFTVGEVEHDARWSFDPRRSSLAPLNSDATQLSRQGSLPEGLIPVSVPSTRHRPRTSPGSTAAPSGRGIPPPPPLTLTRSRRTRCAARTRRTRRSSERPSRS